MRLGRTAYLLRKSVGSKIPQSEFESSVGTIDDDLDGDEGVWAYRASMGMRARHVGRTMDGKRCKRCKRSGGVVRRCRSRRIWCNEDWEIPWGRKS